MGVSVSNTYTDVYGREITRHGTPEFPIACYDITFPYSNVPIHWHRDFEFVLILSGTALLRTSSGVYHAEAGSGIFVNSNVLHTVEADSGEVHIRSIVFDPSLVGGRDDSIIWTNYLRPLEENSALSFLLLSKADEENTALLTMISHAWDLVAEESDGYEIFARSDLSEIIWHLYRRGQNQVPTSQIPELGKREHRLKEMLQYIHQHYSEHISVEQIAGAAYISKSECLRCFRDGLSTSPLQYANSYRLNAAANFLRTTDWQISEIGAACGFTEMSYFSGKFKKQFGCTPSEYRRKKSIACGLLY